MDHPTHVRHLRAIGGRAVVLAGRPVDASTPSVPAAVQAWRLAAWLRWCTEVLAAAGPVARPAALDRAAPAPVVDAPAAAHALAGAIDACADALEARRGDEALWSPFPARPVVATWSRRACHATARTAAQLAGAVDEPPAVDAAVAVDAIDEHLTVVVPHRMARDGWRAPAGVLAVACPDPGAGWTVEVGGVYVVRRGTPDRRAPTSLAGPAARVLAVLAGDAPRSRGVVVRGDTALVDAWTSSVSSPR